MSNTKANVKRQNQVSMRSWYCTTWQDNGKTYFSDPMTGQRTEVEPESRMRLTIESNGNPLPSAEDASLLSQQEAAIDQKLSLAVHGLPVDLSQSESLVLCHRKNGESHKTSPLRNKAQAHVRSKG